MLLVSGPLKFHLGNPSDLPHSEGQSEGVAPQPTSLQLHFSTFTCLRRNSTLELAYN